MLGSLLVSVMALLALWLTRRIVRVRRYWAERGAAYVPPHPLLGNLGFSQRKNPVVWMREQYERYSNAPYIGIWLLWKSALIVWSPQIARIFSLGMLMSSGTDTLPGIGLIAWWIR